MLPQAIAILLSKTATHLLVGNVLSGFALTNFYYHQIAVKILAKCEKISKNAFTISKKYDIITMYDKKYTKFENKKSLKRGNKYGKQSFS